MRTGFSDMGRTLVRMITTPSPRSRPNSLAASSLSSSVPEISTTSFEVRSRGRVLSTDANARDTATSVSGQVRNNMMDSHRHYSEARGTRGSGSKKWTQALADRARPCAYQNEAAMPRNTPGDSDHDDDDVQDDFDAYSYRWRDAPCRSVHVLLHQEGQNRQG